MTLMRIALHINRPDVFVRNSKIFKNLEDLDRCQRTWRIVVVIFAFFLDKRMWCSRVECAHSAQLATIQIECLILRAMRKQYILLLFLLCQSNK